MLRGTKRGLIIVLLVASLVLSFGLGYGLGLEAHPSGLAFTSVEQAWNIILSDYVEKDKIDVNALSKAAIEGMVEALDDPYTAYLDAETYQFEMGGLEGKFEGIGAEVTIRDGQLMVIAPLAGSPAADAGIQPGDAILEIDGVPTSDMSLYDSVYLFSLSFWDCLCFSSRITLWSSIFKNCSRLVVSCCTKSGTRPRASAIMKSKILLVL